jgi:hypothetical protein
MNDSNNLLSKPLGSKFNKKINNTYKLFKNNNINNNNDLFTNLFPKLFYSSEPRPHHSLI